MKKEYLIIGAVVLTIGYFVWRNNQKKDSVVTAAEPLQVFYINKVSSDEKNYFNSAYTDKYRKIEHPYGDEEIVITETVPINGDILKTPFGEYKFIEKVVGGVVGIRGDWYKIKSSTPSNPTNPLPSQTPNIKTCPNGQTYDGNLNYDIDPCIND
jgi:hypothetical protein